MKITIKDEFDKTIKIDAVEFIPRIGDAIQWEYTPFPIVKEVIWSKDLKEVLIFVGQQGILY